MATFTDYYKALTMPTPGMRQIALELLAEQNELRQREVKMRKARLRLTQSENRLAETKEQKLHQEAMEQHRRTEAIQASLRSKMGSRWL